MANIKYRFTMTPEVRVASTIKGTPLTYEETDTNFKLIDEDLAGLKAGTLIDDGGIASTKLANTAVAAASYGSATQSASVTVNSKGQLTAASNNTIAFPIESLTIGTYKTNASITTVIPLDDTIPQNTEGTQIVSVTFTPKSATNKLIIKVAGAGSLAATGHIVYAVFRDAVASAVTAGAAYIPTIDMMNSFTLIDEVVAGSTASTTFFLRVGPGAAGTLRLNGSTTGRFLGGVSPVTLEITEVRA